MAQSNVVFIGISGAVLALDRATGGELWRAELRGSDFVNVVLDGGELFAATKGELYCLDPASGQVRWRNPLKVSGRGLITIASGAGQQTMAMNEKRRRDQQAAAAAVVAAS